MSTFKLSTLTLALLASGLTFPSYSAEDTTDNTAVQNEEIEVLQVMGIQRSLKESQAEKMTNDSIVEAISAEDIGKLPDISIAESLARLPGVAAQRLDGRANVISIRGLAPDFSTATLNGREQTTVSDNRSVEYDQYPSELLNKVVVYKTGDASLTTQAVAGVVDMQTISPLSHGEQSINIGVKGEMNDLGALNSGSTDKGYRANISYIDQFMNDTLGVAFGYTKMQSPNQEERWNSWGYPEHPETGAKVLGGVKPYVRSSELKRDGYLGVIEYAPNDKLSTKLDIFYTDFEDEQILRGIEIPMQWGNSDQNGGIEAITVENGLVTEGLLRDARVLIRNDVNRRSADTFSAGWNANYQLTDNFSINADISMSDTKRQDFGLETYASTGRGDANGATDNLPFILDGNGKAMFGHSLDYSDPNLIKLGGAFNWGNSNVMPTDAQDGFVNTIDIDDSLKTFRLGAEYYIDGDVLSSIEFGLHYSDRHKKKRDNGLYLTLSNYPATLDVPAEYLQDSTSLDFIGLGNVLSYDALGLYNSGVYTEISQNDVVPSRANNSWDVYEKVTTGFTKVNLVTDLWGRPLKGNIGLQVIHTDQSSDGNTIGVDENGIVQTVPIN